MSLLEVRNLSKADVHGLILDNIRFSQKAFQKIALAGETGSGKSTLLKIIAGLEQPDSGEVIFNKSKVEGSADKLVPGHPHIAYLPQYFELQKFLRVKQVLTYANTLDERKASELFKICKIDHLLERKTNELSGGEKQRIALCRLLITQPKLLLLDEPFSNLDPIVKQVLKSVIENAIKKLKITCILVSHDSDDTLPWADEIIVLKEGKKIQQAGPLEIYFKPVDRYVAGLFGFYHVLPKNLVSFFKIDQKILRPEHFKIVANPSSKTKRGKVVEVKFFGDHQLITISISDSFISFQENMEAKRKVGESVYVALKMNLIKVRDS